MYLIVSSSSPGTQVAPIKVRMLNKHVGRLVSSENIHPMQHQCVFCVQHGDHHYPGELLLLQSKDQEMQLCGTDCNYVEQTCESCGHCICHVPTPIAEPTPEPEPEAEDKPAEITHFICNYAQMLIDKDHTHAHIYSCPLACLHYAA